MTPALDEPRARRACGRQALARTRRSRRGHGFSSATPFRSIQSQRGSRDRRLVADATVAALRDQPRGAPVTAEPERTCCGRRSPLKSSASATPRFRFCRICIPDLPSSEAIPAPAASQGGRSRRQAARQAQSRQPERTTAASAVRCPSPQCRRSSAGQSAALVKRRSPVRFRPSALDFSAAVVPGGPCIVCPRLT